MPCATSEPETKPPPPTVPENGVERPPTERPATRRPPRWALAMAFAVIYLVWGSTFLAIRFAVESIPPMGMAAARFLLAGVVLLLFCRRAAGPGLVLGATPRQWRSAAIAGSLFFLGNHGLICWAAKHIPSGLASLIISTEVPVIAVLSSLVLPGQPLTRRVVLGAGVGLSGVAWLLTSQGLKGEPGLLLPSLAVFGASLSWSCGVVFSQRLDLPSDAFRRAGMQMACGGLLLAVLSLALGEPFHIQWAAITAKSAAAMAYLVTFGSILAFGCYIWLLKHIRADAVATHVFVNPLVAVLLGTWIGGERFEPAFLVAGALILCSVAIITTGASKREQREIADSSYE